MNQRRLRVLLVDDDNEQLELLVRLLKFEGFEVETASSPIGVSNIARRFGPDVVLLDVNLPALSGDQLLPLLRRSTGDTQRRFVLFSASDPELLRNLAAKVDADGWIQKGTDSSELARKLRAICKFQ
jgi:two-component system OmpR family response regulator